VWQAYGLEPHCDTGVLLDQLWLDDLQDRRSSGGLYLAVLSLQAILLSGCAGCSPAYRLRREPFMALVGECSSEITRKEDQWW